MQKIEEELASFEPASVSGATQQATKYTPPKPQKDEAGNGGKKRKSEAWCNARFGLSGPATAKHLKNWKVLAHPLYNTPPQVHKQRREDPFQSNLTFQPIKDQMAVRKCRRGIKCGGLT